MKVLTIDDEELNLEILTNYLDSAGYQPIGAPDGLQALKALEKNPDTGIIVLDRMMPNMDGMQFLQKIKTDERYKDIPVIMQTAAASAPQILEGIQAGVYYYLAKPYEREILLSIVKSAAAERSTRLQILDEMKKNRVVLELMEESTFGFKTLKQAQNIAFFISNCFPDPQRVIVGLTELLINAIEHGNLEITYEEKKNLLMKNQWQDEVERRLNLPEYKDKKATLIFKSDQNSYLIHVIDQGKGFDWKKYIDFDTNRMTDPNGRGIAMAAKMSFDEVVYLGAGNEVQCKIFQNK